MNHTISKDTFFVIYILASIGAGISIWGYYNLLEGCQKNIPQAQELGKKQIRAGCNIITLTSYIERGVLPPPDLIKDITLL